MGLAGQRKRQKISHDPNNLHWARNTETYGQRILASQGWEPGQTLGSANAAHAKHLTKASTSHVRIALRDDNLGLGAKPGSGQGPGECTGLDSFQDLLGRLNGKSEAVINKERQARGAVNRSLYAERKYGGWSRFVSAGYLVGGESMEDQLDTTGSRGIKGNTPTSTTAQDLTTTTISTDVVSPKMEKKHRKKKSHVVESTEDYAAESPAAEAFQISEDESVSKAKRKEERALRRLAKAQRKGDRKKRKEEKTAKIAEVAIKEELTEEPLTATQESVSITAIRSTTTPVFAGGRHAVRAKYIMHKKKAMLDSKALNEILMIKT